MISKPLEYFIEINKAHMVYSDPVETINSIFTFKIEETDPGIVSQTNYITDILDKNPLISFKIEEFTSNSLNGVTLYKLNLNNV